MKKQVTDRAVKERLRRRLNREGVRLRKDKDGYFGVNQNNFIEFHGAELASLAAEMEVLKEWEQMS